MKINLKKSKNWFFYWALVGVGTFILFFLVTSAWIGTSVNEKCKLAQGRYGGDCIEALINHLKDEENPISERNSAIWALGQLGDPRALPILKSYYTGDIPNREPWNEVVSQHELKKAINLTSGGFNATKFIWR